MNTQTENKKRLGALDIFIILAVLVCIVSVVWRYISVNNDNAETSASLNNYIVSFDIYDIRESSYTNYLKTGTEFYLSENDEVFGTLLMTESVVGAAKYYTTTDGNVVLVTSTGTGEQARIDYSGKMECQGIINDSGSFLLNGLHYLALDKEVKIYSKYIEVTVKITGISSDESVSANTK